MADNEHDDDLVDYDEEEVRQQLDTGTKSSSNPRSFLSHAVEYVPDPTATAPTNDDSNNQSLTL